MNGLSGTPVSALALRLRMSVNPPRTPWSLVPQIPTHGTIDRLIVSLTRIHSAVAVWTRLYGLNPVNGGSPSGVLCFTLQRHAAAPHRLVAACHRVVQVLSPSAGQHC